MPPIFAGGTLASESSSVAFDQVPTTGVTHRVDESPDFSTSVPSPNVYVLEGNEIASDLLDEDLDFSSETLDLSSSDTPAAFDAVCLTDDDQPSAFDFLPATSGKSCPKYISLLSNFDQAICSLAAAPSPSCFSQSQSPPTPGPPHNSSTVQWYRHFHYHNNYLVNATTLARISSGVSTVLASMSDASDSMPANYAKYIAFMKTLKPTDVVNTILMLVMNLFFHVADGPDICLWATKARFTLPARTHASHSRKKGSAWGESVLSNAVHPHLLTHVHFETLAEFNQALKSWRGISSCYALLAHRLGLGALICARDLLHPASMWGCAQGADRHGASEEAFRHLEEVVNLPEEASKCGADDLMHDLLWEVFDRFAESDDDEERAGGHEENGLRKECNKIERRFRCSRG